MISEIFFGEPAFECIANSASSLLSIRILKRNTSEETDYSCIIALPKCTYPYVYSKNT